MTAGPIGFLRIVQSDNAGTLRAVVFGPVRTEELALGSTDPRARIVVPYNKRDDGLGKDDKLIIEVKPDADGTIDNTSDWRIPVSRMNTRTGQKFETWLSGTDFGLSATNITATAALGWNFVASYTVGAQERIKLGHETGVNSTIYMTLAYT